MVRMRRHARLATVIAVVLTGLGGCVAADDSQPTGGLAMPGFSSIRAPRGNPQYLNNANYAYQPGPLPPGSTFSDIGYATWSDDEPSYRLYPGDELEVTVPSAPELSKTLTVQPDGRVSLPLLAPIMAADRSLPDLQAILTQAYSSQLLRPAVNVSLKSTTPLKVYVGGEVNNPGIYDMAGDGDALRAIFQAGGFKSTGNRNQVAIIRRGPDGLPMMRAANLSGGLRGHGDSRPMDLVPLRRFDVVYVPRTKAAEASQWVQTYFRDLSPIQLGFSYALPIN